ncbi:MAG: hypothetical protein U0R19_20460 [Bryobacteraceae bacterium]
MAVPLRAEPNPFYVHGERGQTEVAHLNAEARALRCRHLLERNLAAQGGFDRETGPFVYVPLDKSLEGAIGRFSARRRDAEIAA